MTTLVSFYTRNWQYASHAARLRSECRALGVPYLITERPDRGNYLANCRWKPEVLREAREKVAGPLLWVDVDGSLLAVPALDGPHDFRAYPKPAHNSRAWHVGTLWFGDTPGARDLLRLWVDALEDDISDELALDRLWKSGRWCGSYAPLPPEYFQIGVRGPSGGTVVMHRLSRSTQKRDYQRHARRRARP